jgi:hypothetical protein
VGGYGRFSCLTARFAYSSFVSLNTLFMSDANGFSGSDIWIEMPENGEVVETLDGELRFLADGNAYVTLRRDGVESKRGAFPFEPLDELGLLAGDDFAVDMVRIEGREEIVMVLRKV